MASSAPGESGDEASLSKRMKLYHDTNITSTAARVSAELKAAAMRRPNSSLTQDERDAKRILKKRLRVQAKVKKLEKRIMHAMSRKDSVVEVQARQELKEFLEKEKGSSGSVSFAGEDEMRKGEASKGNDATTSADPMEDMKQNLLSICNELFKYALLESRGEEDNWQIEKSASKRQDQTNSSNTVLDDEEEKDNSIQTSITDTISNKRIQTESAVELLRNMTKGTQKGEMFSKQAVWGYTRQKFYERAMLVCKSLRKLEPNAAMPKDSEGMTTDQIHLKERAWSKLLQVKNICSIGCGPGNDAAGLVTFLRNISAPQPLEITLIDWMISVWDGTVIRPLRSILAKRKLAVQLKCGKCEVTKPLDSKDNQEARALINRKDGADMYLTSYLLSETRGKWDTFFLGLVEMAIPGSLFYFSEPTPWQLHRLALLCSSSLDFLWLDSSMYHPSLQPLDGRAGPAVLLAMKRG